MRILSSAPTRISLLGGGTDLPVFYEKFGGIVISLAVNLRQHIEIRNTGSKFSISLPENGSLNFYKTFFKETGFDVGNFYLKCESDIPIESGMGSSASAGVALVAALSKLKGEKLTRAQIAEKAWDIEVNKLGLYGGKQDQYAAAFGGYNRIMFEKDGKVIVNSFTDLLDKDNLILFDTGLRRKNPKLQENMKELALERVKALLRIKEIAESFTYWRDLPKLMRQSWEEKKRSNTITSPEIDEIYNTALKNGAEAGKLLGSGGGGFMLFWVEKEKQQKVRQALERKGCIWYDFDIDKQGMEARILP